MPNPEREVKDEIICLYCMHKRHTFHMKFDWDKNKRRSNLLKHRVDFTDAVGVFYDGAAITVEDPDHHDEQRFITIGRDFKLQTLVVINAQHQCSSIRLISARRASRLEREQYEG